MRPTPILPPPVLPRKRRRRRSWLLGLLGFGFASGVVMFVAAAGGGRLLRVEGLARSARLREPRQVRAAGDDAHPCARRQPDGRVRARAAHLRADQRDAEAGHRRLPVGGGQALLRARRSRFHRHRARRLQVPHQYREPLGPAHRGCIDHHAAGGQELPAVERPHARAQAEGGDPRHPHRARLLEGQDPRALPQRDLSRHGLLRRGRRRAQLFQQGAEGARDRGGRLPGGAAEGAQQLSSLPPRQGSDRPAQLDHRPDGRRRLPSPASRPSSPRPSRSRSTSARSARRSTPPTTSPRTCAARWSTSSARMASTAAPSGLPRATGASTAAFRCAPRSIPTCSAWRAGR